MIYLHYNPALTPPLAQPVSNNQDLDIANEANGKEENYLHQEIEEELTILDTVLPDI